MAQPAREYTTRFAAWMVADWRRTAVITLSVALTVIFLIGRPYIMYNDGDPLAYFRKAWFILGRTGGADVPSRGPGYPLWLILTGAATLDTWWGLVASHIAMTIAAPVLFYSTLAPQSRNAAFAGALLFMLFGIPYQHMNWVMPEALFLFVELCALVMMSRYLLRAGSRASGLTHDDRSKRELRFYSWWLRCTATPYPIALLLAYATMVKPAGGIFFWIFVAVCLLFRVENWRRYAGPVALYMAIMAGWATYDYHRSPVRFPQLAQPSSKAQRNFADLYYGPDAAAATGHAPTIRAEDGPASAKLYEAVRKAISDRRSDGKWPIDNVRSVDQLFAQYPSDEDLLRNIFSRPNPVYFQFIVAAAVPFGDAGLLYEVAGEQGKAGFRGYLNYLGNHPSVLFLGPPNPYVGYMFLMKYYRYREMQDFGMSGARDMFVSPRKKFAFATSPGPNLKTFSASLGYFVDTFPQYVGLDAETLAKLGGAEGLKSFLFDEETNDYSGSVMGWIYQWLSLLYGEERTGRLMLAAALDITMHDPEALGFLVGDFLSATALSANGDSRIEQPKLFSPRIFAVNAKDNFTAVRERLDRYLAGRIRSGATTNLPQTLAEHVGKLRDTSAFAKSVSAVLELQYETFKWSRPLLFFPLVAFALPLIVLARVGRFVSFLAIAYFASAAAWTVVMIMPGSDPRHEEVYAFFPIMVVVVGIAMLPELLRIARAGHVTP